MAFWTFCWQLCFKPATWFKTFYCSKCGARLKKIRFYREMSNAELRYWNCDWEAFFCWKIPVKAKGVVQEMFFKCPNCGNKTSVEKQVQIRKKQKALKRSILTEKELESLAFCDVIRSGGFLEPKDK